MSRCLSDRAFYAVYAGDGDARQQAHLALCLACTQRYEELSHRLGTIEHTLRQPPPRFSTHEVHGLRRFSHSLPLVATVVATVFLLTWRIARQQESPKEILSRTPNQDITHFLTTEVPSALFATVEAAELRPPSPISDAAYIEAALTDDWPCEYDEGEQTIACDIHPFPLLVEND